MTGQERADLSSGLHEIIARLDTLDGKVDGIERRLDRWDGAISLIKATASLLGVGGIGLILAAIVQAAQK